VCEEKFLSWAGKEILIKPVALAQANPDLLQWNVLI
jgi:hypothetical protein